MSMTLPDLLAALQAATGPRREIDIDMWLASVSGATRKTIEVNHPAGAYTIDETRENHRLVAVAEYTRSVDAAFSLIERKLPGWDATVTRLSDGSGYAYLMDDNCVRHPHERGATPAIALCAALVAALIEREVA